jgi:hypothetical protein
MLLEYDTDPLAKLIAPARGNIALRSVFPILMGTDNDPWDEMRMRQFPQQWIGFDISKVCSFALHPIYIENDDVLDTFIPGQIEVENSKEVVRFWPGSVAALTCVEHARKVDADRKSAKRLRKDVPIMVPGMPAGPPVHIPLLDGLGDEGGGGDTGCGGDTAGDSGGDDGDQGPIDVISNWAGKLHKVLRVAKHRKDPTF